MFLSCFCSVFLSKSRAIFRLRSLRFLVDNDRFFFHGRTGQGTDTGPTLSNQFYLLLTSLQFR